MGFGSARRASGGRRFRRRDGVLDAGALLLGETDKAIGLIDRFAACFRDARNPDYVRHEVKTLVAQRVFGLALGYEDLNDHDELRGDPVLGVLLGKLDGATEAPAALAGKSTLNRLERADRERADALSREDLRPCPQRAASGAHRRGARRRRGLVVGRARQAGAGVSRLPVVDQGEFVAPAAGDRQGRMDGRREPTRALCVTSLRPDTWLARALYEDLYCARGEMENRIKECQGDLFADRTSAATMRANQLRLWFSSMAYVLICALRRIGLAHTQFAAATCATSASSSSSSARWSRSVRAASRSPSPPPVSRADEWRIVQARLADARGSPA